MSYARTREGELARGVAEEMRVAMARRRINQAALAAHLGEHQTWVSRRLTGRSPITLDELERIARALEVSVAELLPVSVRGGAHTGAYPSPRSTRDASVGSLAGSHPPNRPVGQVSPSGPGRPGRIPIPRAA